MLRPGQEVSWLNVKTTELPEAEEGANTTVEDIGNLGFSVNDQMVIANTEFLEGNPSAKKFFELVKIPTEDINAENLLVNDGENSEEAIKGHATNSIAAHQAEWDKWIAEAKAAQ